jgi:hypothetical protein
MRSIRKNTKVIRKVTRQVVVLGLFISLFSIQQVWAETFCLCDHQDTLQMKSDHCNQHQSKAANQHSTAHHEVPSNEHSSKCHPGTPEMKAPDMQSQAASMSSGERNENSSSTAISCCHKLPKSKVPDATLSVPIPDFSQEAIPVVTFDINTPLVFVAAPLFSPPRPIYLTTSSLLI